MYGLKKAPRQWNAKLTEALISAQFQQSKFDHSLFTKRINKGLTVVLVYVDDMLITCSNLELVKDTKGTLQQAFKMKDLGEIKYFLGIEFARSEKGFLMHQRKYILELISKTKLAAAKPAVTPTNTNIKLTSRKYDEHQGISNSQDPCADQASYQRLIGKLLYLTIIRPEIAYSVQSLSQFLQDPKQSHMEAALRIVSWKRCTTIWSKN